MLGFQISKHAEKRMQQRSISPGALSLLLECGSERHIGGGVRIEFDKKSRKEAQKHMRGMNISDKIFSLYAVVSEDMIITAGYRTKKFKHYN